MRPQIITNWDQVPIVMDLAYASRIVGQVPETLKKRAQRGAFPAYKEGKDWRITKEALQSHIANNTRKERPA